MLNAVAHDHSGTVHPDAAQVAPLLGRVLREKAGWPQRAALEVMTDLLCWSDDARIAEAAAESRPSVELLAGQPETAKTARDLLDELDRPKA